MMEAEEQMWLYFKRLNPDIEAAYQKFLHDPIPQKGPKPPKGYLLEDKMWVPCPEVLQVFVEEVFFCRGIKSHSLAQAQARCAAPLAAIGQQKPGPQSMANILNRTEKLLGLKINQEEYISNRHKMAMEVKEATGKIPMSKDLKKEYQKLKYQEKKAELEELRRREKSVKSQVSKSAAKAGIKAEDVKKTINKTVKQKKVENPQVDAYMKALYSDAPKQELMRLYNLAIAENESLDRKVAFLPTPKQYDFMSASEDIVLYGGAAGGGKSFALLFDAIRYAHIKGYRGVLIRRTMPELRELIDISRELYPQIFRGAKYQTQEKTWRFPSGAVLEFGFLDSPSDKYQYQGKQYAWIGFDELGLQDTPEGFDYLKSRLRTTIPEIKPTIRCTANPGSLWVKERFIDPAPANTTFRDTAGLTYRFIPSLVSDNPYIYQEGAGQYVKMLSSLSEVERRQLLEGDWTVSDDSAFPEFEIKTHVKPADEYYPPAHWNRFCGVDYGFNDQSAAIWGAVNPENGQVVIYREWAERRLDGFQAAAAILQQEREDIVRIDRVVDWTIWNQTGHFGPTIGQEMQRAGLHMRKADKNREGGKLQIHARLRVDETTEEPGMIILDSCPNLIREIQALKKADKKAGQSVEDIKQTRLNGNHNDLYDALRYALMSRPRMQTLQDALIHNKSQEAWGRINKMFS